MRNFKIVVCLVLSVMLTVGVIPMTASAATILSEAAVYNFTTPAAGKTAAECTTATIPGGAHYHILATGWYCETDSCYMDSTDVFQRDKLYSFGVVLEPDSGYEFTVYISITVNGGTSLIDYNYTGIDDDGYCNIWTVSVSPTYSGDVDLISSVNVKVPDMPAVGLAVSELHDPYVDGDAPYTISQYSWRNEDGQYGLESSDVFEEGVHYTVAVMITPKSGYKFASSVTFLINGESALVDQSKSRVRAENLVELVSVKTTPESGAYRVKKITVTGYEKPVIGQHASAMPGFSVPDGAPYQIVTASWFKSSGFSMGPLDMFENGLSYYVRCIVKLNDGYNFTSSVDIDIDAYIDKSKSYISGDTAYIFTKQVTPYAGLIREISITLPEPEIGQTPADLAAPTVSGTARSTVASYAWMREITYEEREQLQSDHRFRAGKKYSCNIVLEPADGYAYSTGVTVTINGSADLVDTNISKELSNGQYVVWSASKMLEGDEEGLITEVNVSEFKIPKAGHTVLQSLIGIQLSASPKYSITAMSWVDGTTPMAADDVFEEGKAYYLVCRLTPADGYYFDSTRLPTVLLNGSGQYVDSPYTRVNSDGELFFYSIEFIAEAGADEVITEVNLLGFTVPTIGETAGENISRLNIPAGASYTVKASWIASYTTPMGSNDTFEEGVKYYLAVAFSPKPGYCFDENDLPDVYFDGSAEYVDASFTQLHDGVLRAASIDIILSAPQLITEISVNGFAVPKIGQTAGELIAQLSVPEDAQYTISSSTWFCFSDGTTSVMTSDETFAEGGKYYLSVYVTAKDGYYFESDNLATPYFNGSEDYVDADYTRFVSESKMQFFSIDLYPEATPEIKYGDVNDDGKLNGQDLIRLRKYLNGENVDIGPGANVNGDAGGVINGQDLIRLRKYLNGENVVLGPSN